MPTFEVDMNGKTFDVEAPSIEHFLNAYHGASGGAVPASAAIPPKQETGIGPVLNRMATWPGRIAKTISDAVVSGATLPRDVVQGKADVSTSEGLKENAGRAFEAVSLANPATPALKTGAQIARRAFTPGAANPEFNAVPPGIRAATTAADLGAPLPAGLGSDNKGIQQVTQAARSMPLVGAELDKRVGGTIDAAGNAVKDISESLSGGIPDRATAGANLRPSLKDVIDDNNSRIDSAYRALRHVIDPDVKGPLTSTSKMLDVVMKERVAAGMKNPDAGLKDIINLVNKGGSFDGLQRARADVGKIIGLAENNPNPGFNVGDFKRIYAAMSGDMKNVVRANARNGVTPDQAAQVLDAANAGTSKLIENNKPLQRLLNVRDDEKMVGSVINAAQDKTGNARLLMQLRNQMPKADFEQIVGVGLSELGHNPSTGEFSLAKFGTSYRKLSDTAKSILFPDPAHRKALEDIAHLDAVLKDSDKYINKSGTARSTALIGGASALASTAATGNIPGVLGILAGGAGGFGLAKYLGRPATASTLAKWIRTAQNAPQSGPARQASLTIATRNLMNNLPGLKRLEAPRADDQRPDAGSVGNPKRGKIPDHYPQQRRFPSQPSGQ